ncbi:MAG TPA: methyltransferase domain-containing protein [Kofleriaceae bacterium]|nr:methyltransferase domain-containing protein [Kofleriaceae bacterium]
MVREEAGDILEGALLCPERACQREHPIIDGIAVIVADLRSFAEHQLPALLQRDDLSAYSESLLGDAAGPGSVVDAARYQLSSYGRVHWGDLDPDEPLPAGDGIAALAGAALALLPEPPSGAWLDLGCSLGRTTFELAGRTGDLALGVDLNIAMLRAARRVLRDGRAVYPHRRVGVVYDRKELAVSPPAAERVDFWACDVQQLPLPDGVAAGALALNLVDCVSHPFALLHEIGRVAGRALLSTPYDWSTNATPFENWLGGHSQRGDQRGSSAAELRRLLGADAPEGAPPLRITAERDGVPWKVVVHERAVMHYQVHLLALAARR